MAEKKKAILAIIERIKYSDKLVNSLATPDGVPDTQQYLDANTVLRDDIYELGSMYATIEELLK